MKWIKKRKEIGSNLTNQTTKEVDVFKSHNVKGFAIFNIHNYGVLYINTLYDLIFDIELFEMIILILLIFIQALKVI